MVALGLFVLGLAIAVLGYESGWRGAERHSVALMAELRKRPDELGSAVWAGMVVEAIEAKRIDPRDVASLDLLNWGKLDDADRRLIIGAASGAYAALTQDIRCRASTGIDKYPRQRPPSPPSLSKPGTVAP